MVKANELERFEVMSDEDLFADIGQKLEEQEGLAAFPDVSRYILRGREWFARFRPEAQNAVCGNEYVSAAIRQQNTSTKIVELVATALLTSAAGFSGPVAAVAVLLVRFGIEELCEDAWSEGAPLS